jgi:exonuclease SbcD
MFTFIHTADIHLDSPMLRLERYEGAPVEELRHATRRAMENLIDLAIARHVNFVLISGDLYDGDWRDYNTGLYLVSQMAMLREARIPVYIIAGNHDAASKMTRTLRPPENVFMFPTDRPGTFYLDDLGIAIHGQGFDTQAVLEDLSAGYPLAIPGYFNIGMLHTCATGREGHEAYAPCTLEGLLSRGYDYWALGHVHKREVLHEDPMIVFPGNIQGRNIRETGPKGCMLVTVDDRGSAELEFYPLDVVRWFRCEIDASDMDRGIDVLDCIRTSLEGLLEENAMPLVVRIEIKGICQAHSEIAADPEHWDMEIRSTAIDLGGQIWIEKVIFQTSPPETVSGLDGPVNEVLQCLRDLRSDPDRLRAFGESLRDLWKKLPMEIRTDPEVISPDNLDRLSAMLDQVQPFLLHRLRSGD